MGWLDALLAYPWVQEGLAWIKPGMLAAFGGIASYIYVMTTQEKAFRWSAFIANVFLAFFVGLAVSGFVPEGTKNISGVVMLLGFAGYRVLGKVEEKIVSAIENRSIPGGS